MAINYIGVDVDSKYLVCQIQRAEKKFPIAQLDNNPPGHRKFIKWATKRQQPAHITMAAMGAYSLPFALDTTAILDYNLRMEFKSWQSPRE